MKHTEYKCPEPCRRFEQHGHCVFCRGGLFMCTVCGGAEASLSTECPGRKLTIREGEAIQEGKLDFRVDKWWRPVA